MQKLILVEEKSFSELYKLLNDGWIIKQISATSIQRAWEIPVCYVLIEKLI